MAEAAPPGPAGRATLAVAGRGEVTVPYDRAEVRCTLGGSDPKSVAKAREVAAQATAALVHGLTGGDDGPKLPTSHVTTGSVSVRQDWEHRPNVPRRLRGYEVTHTVSVRVTGDLSAVASIIDTAVSVAGERLTHLSGPDFGVTSTSTQMAEHKALQLAWEHAKWKAEVLAEAAGMSVGQVLRCDDGSRAQGGHPAPQPKAMLMARANFTETPVMEGEGESVGRSVNVEFELVPRAE